MGDGAERKLAKGEIRFVTKKVGKLWRVYDKARGSFPYAGKQFGGDVTQDVTEPEAQEEADRLNEMLGS